MLRKSWTGKMVCFIDESVKTFNDLIMMEIDRVAFGMALFKCHGYYLVVCSERSLDPIYYFQCANAVLSLATTDSKQVLLSWNDIIDHIHLSLTLSLQC